MRKATPAPERFWPKVHKTESCWLWVASLNSKGYGQFYDGRRVVQAYKFAYEMARGPVPDGLDLDHLCRNPVCVNPAHLEPVTSRANTLRGYGPTAIHARKTHCIRGHELPAPNARRERECLPCKAIRARAAYDRKRAARAA
ncbi:MAG: hypothetical protein JWO98_4720 [Frankiales bacterium]|nr:hypothetical protein [Frankiales bacterium]